MFVKRIKTVFAVMLAAFVLVGCKNEISKSDMSYGYITVNESNYRQVLTSEIASAVVTVRGYDKNGSAFEKKSGAVAAVNGGASNIVIEKIPVCKNAVVTVQGYTDAVALNEAKGMRMAAICDIKAEGTSVNVTWDSSKTGFVYAALIDKGVNTNTLEDDDISSINSAIPAGTDVHASLINAVQIASDYVSGSLGSSDSYKLTCGSVNITCKDYDGYTLQITDPLSSTVTASTSSPVSITGVAPGTWTLYVLEGTTVVASKTVTVSNGGEVSVIVGTVAFDGIQIQVAKSLGYPLIHYWSCSDKTTYPDTSWPGIPMLTDWCDDDYIYNFEGCSSVSLLITKSDQSKLCSENMVITAKGAYRITSSGASASTYISNTPLPPSYSLPSSATVGGTFTITVTSSTALTSGSVTIGGVSKILSVGNNTFNVSDFTSSPATLSVSGTLINEAGSTSISGSIVVKEQAALVSNWNELRIFQVMVSHFQDGASCGYSEWYGPSGQNGYGDLQGIIDALDYIQDLGCNALWMTPIFNSSGKNGSTAMDSTGYYTYDYFDIDPNFGSKSLFKQLVTEAHNRGINIILDGVVGHWARDGVKDSPSGKSPQRSNGQYKGCDYPASLEFFQEVLSYWITEYKIDGWRLDQAYQAGAKTGDVYTGGTNYWPQLRSTVETAAASNGTKGTDWGTLGYMCGEVLDGNASNIQNWVVVNNGLQSCFDFPSRYKLCNAILGGSDWADSAGSDSYKDAMSYTYGTYLTKGYTHSNGYYPNLFLSNHDLLRFGDLIIDWKKYSYGSDNYVGKYKVALASMAAYTGPITLYYGDEWGEATQGISLIQATDVQVGKGAYWDNSSRTTGHIDKAINGSAAEKEVLAYTKKLMAARSAHPALWNGSVTDNGSSGDLYSVKKVSGSDVVYVAINNGTSSKTFNLPENGTNLLTDSSVNKGTVTVPALSAVYVLAK